MRVLVYQGPRTMTLENVIEPQPGPNEALIKVRAAGICGSEVEGYLGTNSLRVPPLIMGHEFSGEIVALGPIEEELDPPYLPCSGHKVTVNPLISCGLCAYCQAGQPHICPQRQIIGVHFPGAFAEYVVVPVQALVQLPQLLDPLLSVLTEPFAVALHALRLAQITELDSVIVWGAGSIGLLTICGARLAHPAQIIAIDRNEKRLEAARHVGATKTLNGRDPDVLAQVQRLVKGTYHTVVFDAVGSQATRQAAIAAAGPAGSVIFLGLHENETALDVSRIIRSEVRLQGSYAYTREDIQRAVSLLAEGQVPTSTWVSVRALSEGPTSFQELVDGPCTATKIVLIP